MLIKLTYMLIELTYMLIELTYMLIKLTYMLIELTYMLIELTYMIRQCHAHIFPQHYRSDMYTLEVQVYTYIQPSTYTCKHC